MNRFDDIRTLGELAGALARGKGSEADDAIGDMVVVLTILSSQRGVSIETCIENAWQEIKDRKGRMVNGVFVKEGDERADQWTQDEIEKIIAKKCSPMDINMIQA